MIRALIFDFDGLLLDTETPALQSWQMIYAEYGQELTFDRWKDALGRSRGEGFDPLAHLASLVGEPFDSSAVFRQRQEHKYALSAALSLQPGVETILAQAHTLGLPCAVASSSDREWVSGWLHVHKIAHAFTCICTVEDVAVAKPAPDLFLCAARCLDVAVSDCLVFEDSPNGVLAARAAGMRCVAVPCGVTAQLEMPPVDLLLPRLDAYPLAMILEQVEGHRA